MSNAHDELYRALENSHNIQFRSQSDAASETIIIRDTRNPERVICIEFGDYTADILAVYVKDSDPLV